MQRLTFINSRGASFAFDSGAPYVFWKIAGTEMPPVEPNVTQAAGQDGYTLTGMLIEARTVRVSGHIHGLTGKEEMYRLRKRLNAVCSPALGLGTLIYENDAGRYRIDAFCKANPYAAKINNIQTLDIMFECPNPYWRSYEKLTSRLAYSEGTLTWPLITPGLLGLNAYSALIVNDGDAPAPMEITIGGGAVNPTVTNATTGEFITVERYVDQYGKIYINSDPERLEVSLITTDPVTNKETRQNAYGYLAPGSTPLKLAVGENQLRFHSDDDSIILQIGIVWEKRFIGV